MLSACGSTVGLSGASGQLQAQSGDLNGFGGAKQSSNRDGQSLQTQTPGDAGTTGASSGPGSSADANAATGGATGFPGQVVAASKKPIEVGFEVANAAKTQAFLKALGVSGTAVDDKVYVQALVNDLNKRGGLAGRQVVPVYYVLDPTRTEPYAQFMAEMYATWTQDHHVVAAFTSANLDWSQLAVCLQKKHVVLGTFGAWARDKGDYVTSPDWFDPAMLASEGLGPAYVSIPDSLGYFGRFSKVGLLVYDYPQSAKLAAVIKRELAVRHITLAAEQQIHMATSTPELSSTITAAQAAVLKFKALGIDHVMSAAYPGAAVFFMLQAQQQNYFPRYALTSYEGLVATASTAPKQQLKHAVGVGFLPFGGDVQLPQAPPLNVAEERCQKIYRAAGISKNDAYAGVNYCDFVRMIELGAIASKGEFSVVDWLAHGIEGIGGHPVAVGFSGLLTATKHDGANAVRGMTFADGCSCWTFTGPVVQVQ